MKLVKDLTDEQFSALREMVNTHGWRDVLPIIIESYINALAHAALHDDVPADELVKFRAEARIYSELQNRIESELVIAFRKKKQSNDSATITDSVG